MMKKHDHLWPEITSFRNLLLAFKKASRGKRNQPSVAAFEYNLEPNLFELREDLLNSNYSPGEYNSFYIHDPKKRLISAAPFRDRIVHHALCNVIEPIFEPRFVFDTYANRAGKGTHRALDRCTHFLRRFKYVLPMDVCQFFPSIDHLILLSLLSKTIIDPYVLDLCQKIIASGRGVLAGEYDMVYFSDDDLLAALRPRGLPIGNLTSQFWANVYLSPLDHHIKRNLKCNGYVRYVDDVRRRETAYEETQRRVNVREKRCKAPTLSRPGNRLGSVAWWERPEFCNPQQTTEGQAKLDKARAKLPKDQFRAVIA